MAVNLEEKPAESIAESTARYYIVFSLNGQEYGIYVKDSREIITIGELTGIPDAPEYITGLIDLRGEIIPIVDLNKKLKLAAQPIASDKVIVISINDKLMGLNVDEVQEIILIEKEDVTKTAKITGEMDQEFLEGVARVNGSLLVLLDLHSIFAGGNVKVH